MDKIIVGFTGSRMGLNQNQVVKVTAKLCELGKDKIDYGLHGDCVGADVTFDYICKTLGIKTWIKPGYHKDPSQTLLRAFCTSDKIDPPDKFLSRDRAIVNACDYLIACPLDLKNIGGGTIYTINYARTKLDHDRIFIFSQNPEEP